MISVDTSVVVRYLVGMPPDQHQRARDLIDGDGTVAISVVVIVETAHVLRSVYGVAGPDIAAALLGLIRRSNVELLGISTDDATDALLRARSMPGRPIPDALIAVLSKAGRATPLFTFDREMGRYGVPVAEP